MPRNLGRPLFTSVLPAFIIVVAQSGACLFFIADALSDDKGVQDKGTSNVLEFGVALALMAGIVLGAVYLLRLVREIRTRAALVAIASGSLSRIIADRFAEWGLSGAEADVALFALKGCSIQDIAQLRSSALGTVRAQLSQVYAKAGVSSQSMLMSLFLEDLMEDAAPGQRR